MKISVVSGGFDPIHSGHISYINAAKDYGEYLIIALNSDKWLMKKKDKAFMPFEERKAILENLKNVDEVIDFADDDKGSAMNALHKINDNYPDAVISVCNGGDRGKDNIPEMEVEGISFVFSVGGDDKKIQAAGSLKSGNTKAKREYGASFIIFLQITRLN